VGIQTVNLLINGKRSVTAETAIGLANAFGTTAEFWLNLQNQVDLWNAYKKVGRKRATASKSGAPARRAGARLQRAAKKVAVKTRAKKATSVAPRRASKK